MDDFTMDDQLRSGVRYQLMCTCGNYFDRADEHGDYARSEVGSVVVHPDLDDYEDDNPLSTRGGWVEVRLRCAIGHQWTLAVANHKGDESVMLAEVDRGD